MAKSPIITTLDTLMADLKGSIQVVLEKEAHIGGLTAAIKSLVGVCEDEDVKAEYLTALDELTGKPGFVSAIRALLRAYSDGLTPGVIKIAIQQAKLMDLTNYSNPAASIHTTLRRMVESGEVEPCTNLGGEKAYRLRLRTPGDFKRELEKIRRTGPPPPTGDPIEDALKATTAPRMPRPPNWKK